MLSSVVMVGLSPPPNDDDDNIFEPGDRRDSNLLGNLESLPTLNMWSVGTWRG
jgi:hypothetical protein